jgi:tRNA threonylcarbamoyladenosine modification (KEOPS) complex  Pcc1 subunit
MPSPEFPITLSFSIALDSTELVEQAYLALLPEFSETISDRSIAHISKNESELLLTIKAKDLIASRAAVNSLIKLVTLTLEIL